MRESLEHKKTSIRQLKQKKIDAQKGIKEKVKSGEITKTKAKELKVKLSNQFKQEKQKIKETYIQDKAYEKEQRLESKRKAKEEELKEWRNECIGSDDSYSFKVLKIIDRNPGEAIAFLQGKVNTWNIESGTLKGKKFWRNIAAYNGWHVQEIGGLFPHWRLLDPNGDRRLYAGKTKMIQAFRELVKGDLSKVPIWGRDPFYDGKKQGYLNASQEYDARFKEQAERYLKQTKIFESEKQEFKIFMAKYKEMIERYKKTNQEKDYIIDSLVKRYRELEKLC